MARSITQNANPFAAVLYGNTNLTATVDANIRAGATIVYQIVIDNTNNGAPTYLQMFNNVAPTVGTTPPDMVLWCPGMGKRTYTLDFAGIQFGSGLSLTCTTTPAGSVNPAAAVSVYGLMS
jgi:hypothetical protein